jgi:hypothetical protein
MKTIIFKSEKKAKVYEIRSAVKQHIYSANELIYIVKTDNINEINHYDLQLIINEVNI